MLATEEIYMEQNMKRMHEVTDPLYFVIDEKLKSVELTDKGFDELSSYTSEPSFFVLPDIVTQLAELENDKSLNDEERLAKKDELLNIYSTKAERVHTLIQLLKAYTMFEIDVESWKAVDGQTVYTKL